MLLGHNARIAWSLTDTQNSATFYYAEQVRGGSYYWRGAWRPLTVVHYTIPVRGAATVNLTVQLTAHGPIMTQAGQKMAVDWMGRTMAAADLVLAAAQTLAAAWLARAVFSVRGHGRPAIDSAQGDE